jgi:hypothetical protein
MTMLFDLARAAGEWWAARWDDHGDWDRKLEL